ncbi:hypothetical protein A4G19_14445 [Pasteurellaceae bacterium Macca]|nr:hypothetical protein [Pasteurellaceae bacterium Macca]MCK3656099.1 hypothetical protein [Pasteurellaceae bacterium Macca]MCK3656120.1 hypothetical protein [Pasteurellaceae bacterium Macca]MCK3656138.1 hypothetical protein [Pasteurellaceae bacterium Macca]MCK3656584.1 hypothetical protein [Pasteurellaceae bacterium Macca]
MTAINKPSGAEAVWGATQDVMTMIGIKRTKLYTMMQEDKTFPQPIRLSRNHIRWNLSEIRQWMMGKEAERNGLGGNND